MLDKIEMSLDEIIRSTKTPRQGGAGGGRRPGFNNNRRNQTQPRGNKGPGIRRGGGGGGGQQTGRIQKRTPGGGNGGGGGGNIGKKFTRGDVNSTWTHDLFDGPRRGGAGGGGGGGGAHGSGSVKLLLSNLDFGVSESDILELFQEFGNLRNHSIHYDRSGRSLGTADIVYERRADALKAMKTYNGVPLDGRPMNIQLATSDVPAPKSPTSRLGNRAPQRNNQQQRGGGGQPQRRQGGGGGAPRGGSRGGQRGGAQGGRPRRAAPTAEELDAELDAYTKDMK